MGRKKTTVVDEDDEDLENAAAEDEDLAGVLADLDATGELSIHVYKNEPGQKPAFCARFDAAAADQVREIVGQRFGGGNYTMRIHRAGHRGTVRAATFAIAREIVPAAATTAPAAPAQDLSFKI